MKNIPNTDNMIITGSNAFFKDIPGFKSKDIDYVDVVENPTDFENGHHLILRDKCIIRYRKMQPDEFVEFFMKLNIPMAICNFLIPEFVKAMGLTFEHLKQVKPIADKLHGKHYYLKVIYDAYINNGDFFLTDEQRNKAYKAYCEARHKKY